MCSKITIEKYCTMCFFDPCVSQSYPDYCTLFDYFYRFWFTKKQIELLTNKKNNVTYSLLLRKFLALATFGNIEWTNFEDNMAES